MRIAEAALKSNLTAHTLRFYEAEELVIPARIGPVRDYADADIERLLVVSKLRSIGFSIPQIRDLLSLDDRVGGITSLSPEAADDIAEVGKQLAARIADIEDRMDLLQRNHEKLRAMQRKLQWLMEQGGTGDESELDREHCDRRVREPDDRGRDRGHDQ